MGRPRTINAAVALFCATTMDRLLKLQQRDTNYIPDERTAKVVKILAEAQVTLQRRKPEAGDEEQEGPGDPRMTIEELEQQTAQPTPPQDTGSSDDS